MLQIRSTLLFLSYIFTSIIISSCGGGGSSDDQAEQSSNNQESSITVSGKHANNFISGGVLNVYTLDGLKVADEITIDSSGEYSFNLFKSEFESGIKLVLTGGVINGDAFTEELMAYYGASDELSEANLTLLTTIIAKLLDQKIPNHSLDSRNTLINELSQIGLFIESEWNLLEPSGVSVQNLHAQIESNGLSNSINTIAADIEDREVGAYNMLFFPNAHGGLVKINFQDELSGFPGDTMERGISIDLVENISSGVEQNKYALSLENAPTWVELTDSTLKINIPNDEISGDKVFTIVATPEGGNSGRKKQVNLLVLNTKVLLEGTLGASGGVIMNDWKDIQLSVDEGKLKQDYQFSYVGGLDENGLLTLTINTSPEISNEESAALRLIEPTLSILKVNYFQEINSTKGKANKSTAVASSPLSSEATECYYKWPDRNGDGFIFDKVWIANHASFNDSPDVHKSLYSDGTMSYENIVGFISLEILTTNNNIHLNDDSFGLPRLQDNVAPANIVKAEKCASALRSSVSQDDPSIKNKTPVLFIHGFIPDGTLGGVDSREYFGKFPKLVSELELNGNQFTPFIFQWKTNARYQDVAVELGQAIDLIKSKTSKKVHVVAHSFGGLLIRTLVQGISSTPQKFNKQWSESSLATITTVGSPHSGIFSSTKSGVEFDGEGKEDFPRGTHSVRGLATQLCRAITCYQSGVVANKEELPPESWSEDEKRLYKQSVISSNPNIYGLKNEVGYIPYKLYKTLSDYPDIPTQQLIGLTSNNICTPESLNDSTPPTQCQFRIILNSLVNVGDGLISVDGQRFNLEKAFEVGNSIINLSLWSSSTIEEHLLGFKGDIDFYDYNDYIHPLFDNDNVYNVSYASLDQDGWLTKGSQIGLFKYVTGYYHSDTQYLPSINNYIGNIYIGKNEQSKNRYWNTPQLTEVGLNNCIDTNNCNHATWGYFVNFLSAHISEEVALEETINVSAKITVPVAISLPIRVFVYADGEVIGEATGGFNGVYILNDAIFYPSTEYYLSVIPDLGTGLRGIKSMPISTNGTASESNLDFPVINLASTNIQTSEIIINFNDSTGASLSDFSVDVFSSTRNLVETRIQFSSGDTLTLPIGRYTIKATKFGYGAATKICDVNVVVTSSCNLFLASSLNAVGLNAGLVAHYEFEGNANDSSDNGFHGIVNGGATFVSKPSGQAISLNNEGSGSGEYVRLSDQSLSSAYTITYDVKFDSNTSNDYAAVFSIGDHTNGYFISHFVRRNEGNSFLMITNKGVDLLSGPLDIDLTDKGWHSLAYVIDVNRVDIYRDRMLIASATLSEIPQFTNSASYLGAHTWNSGASMGTRFNGLVDNLKIYRRALNAAEISELYNSGNLQTSINDVFDSSALNAVLWRELRRWDTDIVTVENGLAHFSSGTRADTCGKVTFKGDSEVVIEARFAGQGPMRDTHLEIVDVKTGEMIQIGDTNYRGWGLYAFGFQANEPVFSGLTTTSFKEYRLTINDTSAVIERGDSFSTLNESS